MISLFWSCSLPNVGSPQVHCFSEQPQEGEVRIHSISCSSEIETSFTRRGDWVLENHEQRVVFRHQSSSLTSSTGAGASIIQIGEAPILFELRAVGLPTPLEAREQIEDTSAILSFYHEEEHVLSYTLPNDEKTIYIESDTSFFLTPLPNTQRVGTTLYTQSREHGMFIHGDVTQEEQGLHIENLQSIHTEDWEYIHEENGQRVELQWGSPTISPHSLLLRAEDQTWFLPFLEETFSGYIPAQALEWTLWHPSCQKNWVPIDQLPSLGSCSQQLIRVSSEGAGIWGYANETLIAPQGSIISSEEDEYPVFAGPAYEQAQVIPNQNHVSLEKIFPNVTLFSPLEISIQPEKTLAQLLGNGIQNTVISTKNFISSFSLHPPLIQEHIHVQRGFLLENEEQWLLSWPWEAIIREPGMGAVPFFSSYQSQLSYVDRQGRISVSNLSFFEKLQEESLYVHPDFLFISDTAELEILYQLLDGKTPLRFLGPQNAIPQTGPLPESTLIRALLSQEHSFGNGPLVLMFDQDEQWHIQAYAPSWMEVETLRVVTQGGSEYMQWDFSEEQSISVFVPKIETDWVLAEVQGTHWAVGPILFPAEQE